MSVHRVAHTSVLWSPGHGTCGQCGLAHLSSRLYTDGRDATRFCPPCWSSFLDECTVADGPLRSQVSASWYGPEALVLEFEEERIDGATQDTPGWD